MRIEVYNEKKPEPEKVLRLRFEQGDQVTYVVAVDEEGNPMHCGYLLAFRSNGTVVRCSSVNPDLGLKLDASHQVVFE